ncbi:DUF835 domain-containing protein [Palaeococcus ferrophilus]|uniref:DUF835 domain-containing protein n=1 Tax=Palaeococcus ferrophilus TaxID=83868 RepID=UPI001FE01150|nr:DUF835 domain-containing protein [Palaeococcus ferrophilus]
MRYVLEILNVVMRFFTWGFSFYKWVKKREEFMLFLSVALWIDFLAVLTQKPILAHLGWVPEVAVLIPLLSTFAVIEGTLLIAAALLVLDSLKTPWGQLVVVLSVVLGSTYVLVGTLLNEPPTVLFAFPLPFMGASLILVGYALIKEEVGVKNVATLFPLGLILLGSINATYPLTIKTPLAPYLYGAGAVFRAMVFVGMARYALFHVVPPRSTSVNLPPGAFYVETRRALRALVHKMQRSGNGVLITRNSPQGITPTFPVFWITRVISGRIRENTTAISPTDIGILLDLVRRHLEKGHSLVVVDSLEYLVVENGFENAFKFLLSLKDNIMHFHGTLIVLTSPSMYSENQWALISRELERLDLE